MVWGRVTLLGVIAAMVAAVLAGVLLSRLGVEGLVLPLLAGLVGGGLVMLVARKGLAESR